MNLRRTAAGLGRRRHSPAARLIRRGRMNRSSGNRTDRAWAHLDRVRLRRALRSPEARWATLGLCGLALLLGALTSGPITRLVQGDLSSESPTRIQTISVQGNLYLSPRQVARATGIAMNSLASALDAGLVKARLIEHPWIRDAAVLAIPTGRVIVLVEEREPHAVLYSPLPNTAMTLPRLVDTTGIPFARVAPGHFDALPALHSATAVASGTADSRLLEAVAIAEAVAQAGGRTVTYSEIHLPDPGSNEGWVLRSESGSQRVILGRGDLAPRIERLSLLLASDLGSARVAEEIDLRFADRAVMRSASLSR